jgi:hypothetical protein
MQGGGPMWAEVSFDPMGFAGAQWVDGWFNFTVNRTYHTSGDTVNVTSNYFHESVASSFATNGQGIHLPIPAWAGQQWLNGQLTGWCFGGPQFNTVNDYIHLLNGGFTFEVRVMQAP